MNKEWLLTWLDGEEKRQKKVDASCIVEAMGKAPVNQSMLIGINYIVDVLEDQPEPTSCA